MAKGPLVIEQAQAGAQFLAELQKHVPVKAAFWLLVEDEGLDLFFAADRPDDWQFNEGRRLTRQIADALDDPHLNPVRIILLGPNDPKVLAAEEVYRRYPNKLPIHWRDRRFGDVYAEELYLYPPSAVVAAV